MTRRSASAGYRAFFPHGRGAPTTVDPVDSERSRQADAAPPTTHRLASAGYRLLFRGDGRTIGAATSPVTSIARPGRPFTGDPDERFTVWLPHVRLPAGASPWLRSARAALVRSLPLLLLLAAATAIHAINMFGAPFYFDDEGIYMSQAWSVATSARLAPYTYFYDHPPLGWFTIAAWVRIFGGFGAFGVSVNAGRVLMLVVHAGSMWLVYQNTKRLGGSAAAAVVALLCFALSPFQLLFGREVLLDNLAAFWMLVSLYMATSRPLTITAAIASGTAMGVALLNKEIVGPMLPGLLIVLWVRLDREVRLLAITGWLFSSLSLASLYPLFALLKGELFPYGSVVDFASKPHVSLVGAVMFHQNRASDHGIFESGSLFWNAAGIWWNTDPVLVVATLSAMASALVLAARYTSLLGVGVMLAGLLAFLARGGVVFDFWLLSAVPLVAIVTGITIGHAWKYLPMLWRREHAPARLAAAAALSVTIALIATAALRHGSYADAYQRVLTNDETQAQSQAITWVKHNVDANAFIVIDTYAYVDLRGFDNAHSFWKVDLDPDVKDGVLGGNWRKIDYIILTPVMSAPVGDGQLPLVAQALAHSTMLARFESGGNWVEVRRVSAGAATDDHGAAVQQTGGR